MPTESSSSPPSPSKISSSQMEVKEIVQMCTRVGISGLSVGFGIIIGMSFLTINMHFAGMLNIPGVQSGIGLANVMINCTGYFFLVGMNQGFGSLFARAFSYQSQSLQRDYYAKGFATVIIMSVGMILFMFFLEEILLLMHQEPLISSYARKYGLGISFGTICLFFFDFLRNYLNAIGEFTEPIKIQAIAIATHYLFCELFCNQFALGFEGIIVATNLNFFVLLLMLLYIAHFKMRLNVIPHLERQKLLHNFKKYLSFCLPIALPMVVSGFGFESNSLLIGSMQIDEQFNAHIVICNFLTILFAVMMGLSGTLCTLISNAIGENDHFKVQKYFKIQYVLTGFFALCSTLVLFCFSEDLGYLYTNDEGVVEQLLGVVSFYKYTVYLDYISEVQQGVIKGIGHGKNCLRISLFCSFVLGIPLSAFLGIGLGYELKGFWVGFIISYTVCAGLQLWLLLRVNWAAQVQEQNYHIQQDQKQLDEFTLAFLESNVDLDTELIDN